MRYFILLCCVLLLPVATISNDSLWIKRFYELESIEERVKYIYNIPLGQYLLKEDALNAFLAEIKKDPRAEKGEVEAISFLVQSNLFLASSQYGKYISIVDSVRNNFSDYPLVEAGIYSGLSLAYFELGSFLKGQEYYQLSESIYERILGGKRINYRRSGNFYFQAELYEEAILDYKEGYADFVNVDTLNHHFLGSLCNNIGLCFFKLSQSDSALYYYELAKYHWKKIPRKFQIPYLLGLADGNRAQIYIENGNYQQAVSLLKTDIRNSINVNRNNAIISMLRLAECYDELEDYQLAKNYCDSADYYIDPNSAGHSLLMDWYLVKSKVYKHINRDKEAINYLETYIKLEKKHKLKENQISSQHYAFLFDVEQKQKRIDAQKIEILRSDKIEAENDRLQWISSLITSAIIIIIIFSIVVYAQQQRIRRQLGEKKERAETNLAIKDAMVKEIHHRVKNNLQVVSGLLQLQSNSSNNEELKEELAKGKSRISSIAAIHQLLYEHPQGQEVEMQLYFEKLIKQNIALQHRNHRYIVDTGGISLLMDDAISLGLILNEMITNTCKHAFENDQIGDIAVCLKISDINDKNYEFSYADNGKGIDIDINIEQASSLGLRLISMMAKQLDGDLMISSKEGTTFRLAF